MERYIYHPQSKKDTHGMLSPRLEYQLIHPKDFLIYQPNFCSKENSFRPNKNLHPNSSLDFRLYTEKKEQNNADTFRLSISPTTEKQLSFVPTPRQEAGGNTASINYITNIMKRKESPTPSHIHDKNGRKPRIKKANTSMIRSPHARLISTIKPPPTPPSEKNVLKY